MINTGKLAGQTLFITGASRGIGKAIALKAAKDGANIVIAAKTAEPHPKLPGTIYTAAKEVEDAGGKALPCIVDVRDEGQVRSAVEAAVQKFGGIDIVVNNASAISLTGTLETPMKRYDLMNQVNARGTFLVSQVCIPFLKASKNPHILNLSPPLNMNPIWFKNHVAYTMAKYGMSMCALGMAEEFRRDGIAVNALWPRTAITTAAMDMIAGKDIDKQCRKPEIMADAAYAILTRDSRAFTGNFVIDDEILREEGIKDLDQYAVVPGNALLPDFFLDVDPDTVKSQINSTEPKPADASDGGRIAKLFDSMKPFVNEELVSRVQATYAFDVKGAESGKWFLDLKSGSGSSGKGDPPGKADVTMTMDSNDFFNMFAGNLKPAAAFMSGKLKMKGDLAKAMKLEKMMNHLKSKL